MQKTTKIDSEELIKQLKTMEVSCGFLHLLMVQLKACLHDENNAHGMQINSN